MKTETLKSNHPVQEVKPDVNSKPLISEPPVSLRPSSVPNVRLAFYQELQEDGKRRALQSKALKVTDEALKPLIDHALAMAKDAFRECFDPKLFIADQIREQEYLKTLKDRDEAEIAMKNLAADLEEIEREMARIKPIGNIPAPPPKSLQAGATFIIGLTVAATLHDQVFPFADDLTAWAASFAVGLLCGWFVVGLILYHPKNGTSENKSSVNWVGVLAGVAVGLGFLILRLAQAHSLSSLLFAVGMTVLEIAAVLGLHNIAGRYTRGLEQWKVQEQPYAQMAASLEVARQHLATREREFERCQEAVESYRAYQEERQLRNQQREEIEDLAVKGIIDGYHEGVEINLGRTRGLKKGGSK